MTHMRLGRHTVEISRPDKLLCPDDGITKANVAEYYQRVGRYMLPHVRARPLTLQRFPDGLGSEGFVQQQRPRHFPDWVDSCRARRAGGKGEVDHVVANRIAALVYLAGQGTLAFHRWLSRTDRLGCPDRLVFDLDPPDGADFAGVRDAARTVGDFLRELRCEPWCMTTGSSGMHVVVALDRSADFDAVRKTARAAAEVLATRHPDRFTVEQRINKRTGRLYLDTGRNAYGQTAVAPYSLRALPGAPVATPLAWDELKAGALHARRHTLVTVVRRLERQDDPWRGQSRHAVSVAALQRRLKALRE